MRKPPRVLCLDLGDVVTRICHNWAEAAAQAGLSDRIGAQTSDELEELLRLVHLHQIGVVSNEEHFERVAALYGYRCPVEEVAQLHRAILLGEHPNVDRVLACAKQQGLVTACLSNTDARHWEIMLDPSTADRFPAFHALDRKFGSHLFGLAKPDLAIYERAARALDAAPDEILFFDDREENVDAARVAGWRAERILPGEDNSTQIATGLRRHGLEL